MELRARRAELTKQKLEKWPSVDSWRVGAASAGSKILSAKTQGSQLPATPELGTASIKSASMRSSVSITHREPPYQNLCTCRQGLSSSLYTHQFLCLKIVHDFHFFFLSLFNCLVMVYLKFVNS